MVIVKIFQGLGNQMFQYAYGWARARDLNTELLIDTSYFNNYSEVTQFGYTYKRDFGLNHFNIKAREAEQLQIDKLLHPRDRSITGKLSNFYRINFASYNHKFYVKEPALSYHPKLLDIMDNTYADGYFTDERYFKKYRTEILEQFQLSRPVSEKNKPYVERVVNENSVCISIRRTNFLNNPLHGTCGEDYYYDAMDVIAGKVKDPVFYVFSDDNEWVNKHFRTNYNYIPVQHNYPDFYEDFRLMVKCKHHIIPNSTYSWWAAWLGQSKQKIVIAPKYWLNSTDIDYSAFVPEEWIRLEHTIHTKFKGD